jgi:hypothetical protein
MLTLLQTFYAVQIAALAQAIVFLMRPGHILDFWPKYLASKAWAWPSWVRKPLGECPTCMTGQIGFWSGAIVVGLEPFKILIFTAFVILIRELINDRIKTT